MFLLLSPLTFSNVGGRVPWSFHHPLNATKRHSRRFGFARLPATNLSWTPSLRLLFPFFPRRTACPSFLFFSFLFLKYFSRMFQTPQNLLPAPQSRFKTCQLLRLFSSQPLNLPKEGFSPLPPPLHKLRQGDCNLIIVRWPSFLCLFSLTPLM